jgi:protein-disulfide isomerase
MQAVVIPDDALPLVKAYEHARSLYYSMHEATLAAEEKWQAASSAALKAHKAMREAEEALLRAVLCR